MIKIILSLIYALPDIIRLIGIIEKHGKEVKRRSDVKKKIDTIAKAYETGDVDAINNLFK